MAENPFLKKAAEALEPAESEAEGAEAKPESEGKPAPKDEKSEESPLFAKASEGAEDLFEPEAEEEADGKSQTIPYDRFSKVIRERNIARDEKVAAEAKVSALEQSVKQMQEFASVVTEKYSGFDNPAGILRQDADFMSAFDQLAQSDSEVKAIADRVLDHIKTGGRVVPDVKEQGKVEPTKDTRIDALIQSTARDKVAATLETLGVKPSFQKIIGDAVVAGAKDPAALDKAGIVEAARDFITENGFTPDDVLSVKAEPESGKQASKSPTGGKAKAGIVEGKGEGEKGEEGPPVAKSIDEWEANRAKRLSALGQ